MKIEVHILHQIINKTNKKSILQAWMSTLIKAFYHLCIYFKLLQHHTTKQCLWTLTFFLWAEVSQHEKAISPEMSFCQACVRDAN